MVDLVNQALAFGPQLCTIALLIAGAIRSGGTFRIMVWVSVGCTLISLIIDVVHLKLGPWDWDMLGWVITIDRFFSVAAGILVLLVIILARPGVRNNQPSG